MCTALIEVEDTTKMGAQSNIMIASEEERRKIQESLCDGDNHPIDRDCDDGEYENPEGAANYFYVVAK